MARIKFDIEELIMALENDSEFGEFYFDKESSEIILISDYTDIDVERTRQQISEEPDRFLRILPIGSRMGWDIMNDFVESLKNRDAQDVLNRALNGKRPFRTFKDDLCRFPKVREQWFDYQAARMTKIAQDWLAENQIAIDAETGEVIGERSLERSEPIKSVAGDDS